MDDDTAGRFCFEAMKITWSLNRRVFRIWCHATFVLRLLPHQLSSPRLQVLAIPRERIGRARSVRIGAHQPAALEPYGCSMSNIMPPNVAL